MLSRNLAGEVEPRQKRWLLDAESGLPATINLDLPQEVSWLALYSIGLSHQARNENDAAERAYQAALRSVENNPRGEALLYFNLGYLEALAEAPDHDRVIAYYSEALAREEDLVPAHNNRAVAYIVRDAQGDLERAEQDLMQGLAVSPDHPVLLLNLGLVRIWLDQDNRVQAIEAFERAAEIDPQSAAVQNALCWNLSLAGNPDKALTHCEQAVALDPSANHYDSYGLTLALLDRYQEAAEAFQTALDLLENHDPERYLVLAVTRSPWIEALSNGESPFDPETLQALMLE
jgi:tetratricopeptide (TPR) repeat protein